MIKLSQAVIVEGKYDKIKLSRFIDATIITTDGFAIFKDAQKLKMIRDIAEKRGIIILTDSDSAGFLIRNHLLSSVRPECIINAYIPDIKGRERRKKEDSKEGLLGVEGVSEQVIADALKKAGVNTCDVTAENAANNNDKITSADFYELGLTGADNSEQKRTELKKKLGLPARLSSKALLQAVNALYSRREFLNLLDEI